MYVIWMESTGLQLLISSLPRSGEEQTAADKPPRSAAEGGGLPGRQGT